MVDQHGEHTSRNQLPRGWSRTGAPPGLRSPRPEASRRVVVACVVGLVAFVGACTVLAPGGSDEPNAGERWIADLTQRRWSSARVGPCDDTDPTPSDLAIERRLADDFGAGIDYSSIDWSTAADGSAIGIVTIGGAGYLIDVDTRVEPGGWRVCAYDLEPLDEP